MAAKDDYLLDNLIEMGYVTNDQLVPIRQDADSTGEGVVDTLVSKQLITATVVAQARAAHFNTEFINISELRLPDEVLAAIPRHVAKRYNVVPVRREGTSVVVARCLTPSIAYPLRHDFGPE